MVAGDLNPILHKCKTSFRIKRIGAVPEIYILAVGDASLDAPTPVRGSSKGSAVAADKRVVVLAAWHLGASKARTDFEGLCGRNR